MTTHNPAQAAAIRADAEHAARLSTEALALLTDPQADPTEQVAAAEAAAEAWQAAMATASPD